MPPKSEELIAAYERPGPQFPDGVGVHFAQQNGDTKTLIGRDDDNELTPGLSYKFAGYWTVHHKHGPQFRFSGFQQMAIKGRTGVVAYLAKHIDRLGPIIAGRLFDRYGNETIAILEQQPKLVAEQIHGISRSAAERMAKQLKAQSEFRDTKIELMDLFDGLGFRSEMISLCIKAWGVKAAAVLKKDPWLLLERRFPGAGFLTVDRLHIERLGLPSDMMKRQIMAAWHVVDSDSSGSTWIGLDAVEARVGQKVSGNVLAREAVGMAVEQGWLAVRDDVDGRKWIADRRRADNEAYVAKRVKELM